MCSMCGSSTEKCGKPQKNTRQLLLDAAFNLLSRNGFERLSLADIAFDAGVSKPAIYRHFSGKDDLLAAMREQFFEETAAALNYGEKTSKREKTVEMIAYFLMNPQYAGYALISFVSDENFEREAGTYYRSRGVRYIRGEIDFFSVPQRVRLIYSISTVVFLMMKYFHGGSAALSDEEARVFAEKAVSFLEHGWMEAVAIDGGRLAELDVMSVIGESEISPDSRFFAAFSAVIKKAGFPGVTVEQIAKEMGMAKSSLYSSFMNKEQLMRELILDKVQNLNDVLKSHLKHACSISEAVYMHMRVTYNFICMRETLIPIMGWLRMQSGHGGREKKNPAGMAGTVEMADSEPLSDAGSMVKQPFKQYVHGFFDGCAFPDVGTAVDSLFIERWLTSAVVSLIIQGKNHGLTDADIENGIKQLHSLIGCGIGELHDTNGKK